jgi:hypothetical protein
MRLPRSDYRHRHYLGSERARNWRSEDVGNCFWRRRRLGCHHSHDGAVSARRRFVLSVEPRFTPIHQSLVRPILLAGAERPLAIANWITAAALILGAGT